MYVIGEKKNRGLIQEITAFYLRKIFSFFFYTCQDRIYQETS